MLKPITNNFFFVEAPNKARFPYCHCLLIKDELNVLIDTGCGAEQVSFLNKEGIDIIINSHFHEDHILNNNSFENSEVWAHTADAPAIRSMDTFMQYYGFDQFNTLELGQSFIDSIKLKPSKVEREIIANEELDFGKIKLQVIHTPGHTPGHCCFYEEKNGLLFLGDIDLSTFGPWYGHICSDLDDFIDSIQTCIALDPNIAISGHKGVFTNNIKSLLNKYLDTIYIKEDMILKALITPQTLDELTNKQMFYGKHLVLDPLFWIMEKMAIINHIKRLIKHNLVENQDDLYYLKG
ncbi:MAG TPA: MBL fold metallo-hydrolase [Syntrophomonadaceae bacterium]|nr:MBL fold metallo-hydrolase [Syntrophomonadaceae bacterium]